MGPVKRIPSFFRGLAALAVGCSLAGTAAADEVRVFAAPAFQPVVTAVAPLFQKRTGHTVALANAGDDFDLAVLPQPALEALGRDGAVSDNSIIALARGRGERERTTVYAGAVSTSAASSQAALSLLVLLASEETQPVLRNSGLSAP